MHLRYLPLLLIVLLFNNPVTSNENHTLVVIVENIRNNEGILRICIFEDEENFMHDAKSCGVVIEPETVEESYHFHTLPEGYYAVIAYHDRNNNGVLDRNFLGIPKEPYGFSNNPSTRFGPPDFDKARFRVPATSIIRIQI